MINIKSSEDIIKMRAAAKIAAGALKLAGSMIADGISTLEIDEGVRKYIKKMGAYPSFLGYGGFPNSTCISIDNKVIHGIPSKGEIIKSGNIVSVDVGAFYEGFHGDCAETFAVLPVSKSAEKLINVTRQSFFEGLKQAYEGNRIGDIGNAIDNYCKSFGFYVVKKFVGHGIGAELHEEPQVPNFGTPGRGPRLCRGMTLAIEPMVNAGTDEVNILSDKWTVITADGSLSAHYENTVLITSGEPEILTVAP